MYNKKILLIGFFLVACIQLYVPAKMIYNQENVLKTGKQFKFKAAPIDPNDPFRGKYITLRFEANTFTIKNTNEWTQGQKVFVMIQPDSNGYAKVQSVLNESPGNNPDYVKANIGYVDEINSTLFINYPFDRFYMEESKAQPAEDLYRKSIIDSTQVAYALVHVKNGEAVIKNVMINGKSIADLIKIGANK